MNKQELRTWARNKRKELDMITLSSILAEKLANTEEYKNSENIMIFYPKSEEINLLSLLSDSSKNFYLPRIKDQELECCLYKIGDKLCESCFHTQEPTCASCNKTNIDMVIVPALACDKNNYRLGYGGGYYDRFLKDFKGKKVSCIPSLLVVETVFPENFDIKMDTIITELPLQI